MSVQVDDTAAGSATHGSDAETAPPPESLRCARVMLIAAGLPEVGPVEAALRVSGAITERVHPRDNWRWLFFERRPHLLIAFVSVDEEGGGLAAEALAGADLTSQAPVLALVLPGVAAPAGGVSDSLPAGARADVIAAEAAQLLAPHQPAVALRAGTLALDADGVRAWLDGRPVPLTPTEYALLAALLATRSRVLSYERIQAELWPQGGAPSVRGLAVHLTRLRAKLAGVPGVRIAVMRGVGYRLDLDGAP